MAIENLINDLASVEGKLLAYFRIVIPDISSSYTSKRVLEAFLINITI